MQRRHTALLALSAAALVVAGCGSNTTVTQPAAAVAAVKLPVHVPPGTTLRVGDQGDALKLPLQLSGQDGGTPYSVSYATFSQGPPLLEAFQAGALDIGLVGDTVALKAQASHQDIVVVAAYRSNGYGQALVVPPGRAATIHTLADLRGRSVAYPFGTALQGFAVEALHTAGLVEKDVQHVELAIPDVVGALKSGGIDAGVLVEPTLSRYVAANPGARVLRDSTGLVTGLIYLVSSTRVLSDPAKVAAIADYIGREARAHDWVNAHPQAWVDGYYVKRQGLPAEIATHILDRIGPTRFVPIDAPVVSAQQGLIDLFVSSGVIPARLDAARVFDRRFNPVVQPAAAATQEARP